MSTRKNVVTIPNPQVHPHHIQTLQQQHHLQQQQMHQQGSPGLLSPPLQQQAEQLHPPQNQQELRHLYNQVANHHQNQHQQNVQQSIQQVWQLQLFFCRLCFGKTNSLGTYSEKSYPYLPIVTLTLISSTE